MFDMMKIGAARRQPSVRHIDPTSSPTAFSLGDDLPCPWCSAPTTEADPRCPSCGRRFG